MAHGSSLVNSENNDHRTTNSQLFTSPVSSPDIVPPSPVLKKKKANKAKRSLSKVLVDVFDKNASKDKSTSLQTTCDPICPQKTSVELNLTTGCTSNLKKDDYIDSQSTIGTESLTSTIICDETDYCSDLYFDDWNDCSTSVFKYYYILKLYY